MNNKKKTSLGIIALVLLTFGITGVHNHANDSSDVMEAESVDEGVLSEEDYDRMVFFNGIQEDEHQRLMNDRLKFEQAKIDKIEADRQAEIKLAEEARLEEERKEAERVAQAEREAQAEENRIKEAERVAQAEREAQAQTTTASQTPTQPAATQKSTPAPKPAPAPQPVIGPNKIGINGVYKSYTNYGKSDRATLQRGVDQGLIVAALTHFNPSDGQTTYFGGHNPGVMNFMASNMYHGAIVTVTDSNGNPHRYKMVDHVNTDNHGGAVFQSIGQSAIEVYTFGSNQESILIQFCNTSNTLMSLWYGVPVN